MSDIIETNKYKLTIGQDGGYSIVDFLFTDREVFYSNVPRYLDDQNNNGKTLDSFEREI